MTRRVVGVLGGMGPEATILLQQRLLQKIEARDDADHLPLLIDMNPQVPSRIAHLIEGRGENPGPVLAGMAQRLETAGATALAMPCNTAHHYAPFITAAATVPFLDMVALSVAVARQNLPQGAKVGILASPAVKMAGVFDEPLKEAGLSALWPADADRMLTAIKQIKVNGPTPDALGILTDAATELTRCDADMLFVACSEFSLMAEELVAQVPIVDTVDVLATAIHDHTTQEAS
ncbi:aspartate/glutamate racemase family protein [Leisingera methylohalidivorans]|uniref:Aspartate racemase n=1 Tax=Leisingera methylohalidivorans DSM 14336 TaxID=999552 RepID=V9W1K9_9RHOB|nr:amino acid racemase [Leisingera methylohalidivorans]AHD03555.1 aspartate racemase [Leisingera methylohalidivorans DSM 14336]